MGSSGNRSRTGGTGLSMRSAQEMREAERGVLADPPVPPPFRVFVPQPNAEDQYQVLVYCKAHKAFIHRCYAASRDLARREMDAERAMGTRVQCRELNRFVHDGSGGRPHPRVSIPPSPKDPRVEALQLELKAAWEAQGRSGIAMPAKPEKLKALIRQAREVEGCSGAPDVTP